MSMELMELALAGLVLLGTHLGISSTPARAALAGALGERGYLGVYSLIATAAFGYFIWSYSRMPRFEYAWMPDPNLYWVTKVVMAPALFLLVGGFMVKNPTTVGLEGALKGDNPATGVLRITRHPFQWSVVLWAAAHMVANGDHASLVFFGVFGVLGLAGSMLIDRKKAARLGEDWSAFARVTSNVPLGAVFAGRNRLVAGELVGPLLVAAVVYVAIFYGHEWLAGVPIFL